MISFIRVSYRELKKPFEIHIDVFQEYNLPIVDSEESEYEMEEDETESESEMEEETEDEMELGEVSEDEILENENHITVRKSFNSDKCVICLSNKPDILFINCLHRCVCLECEKRRPFNRCPSCKTDISMKINI